MQLNGYPKLWKGAACNDCRNVRFSLPFCLFMAYIIFVSLSIFSRNKSLLSSLMRNSKQLSSFSIHMCVHFQCLHDKTSKYCYMEKLDTIFKSGWLIVGTNSREYVPWEQMCEKVYKSVWKYWLILFLYNSIKNLWRKRWIKCLVQIVVRFHSKKSNYNCPNIIPLGPIQCKSYSFHVLMD